MKIAILYICTGKYKIFWKDFYLSCEKYFINEAEKEYFVFTDSPEINFEKENNNIHRIFQKNLGWPQNTLLRYDFFLKQKEKIEKSDFLFFFNANLLFIKEINSEDFLPQNGKNITACIHPGYVNAKNNKFPYERNQKSTAFIPYNTGKYYFQGAINGGETKSFIKAIETINKNIEIDINNNIVATWHDESHWNKFLLDKKDVKILTPSFLYPENSQIPFEPIIIIRDKDKFGGYYFLRGTIEKRLIINKIKKYIKKIIQNIIILFK